MRRMLRITIAALFVSCGVTYAGPVLLGTISNTSHATDPSTIQEYVAGDRLLYEIAGDARSGDLFEGTRVLVRRDGTPVTVDESVTADSDPDFSLIAELLTDGVSLGDPDGTGFQSISVLGMIGVSEQIIDVHVPRISEFDLFGYEVERIDRHVTFSITTPSGDPTTVGTEFHMGGVYELWGSPIPEPTTLGLLAVGSLILLRRRRPGSSNNSATATPADDRRSHQRPNKSVIPVMSLCVVAIFSFPASADFASGVRPNWTLWRTGTACPVACPAIEANTVADLFVSELSQSVGQVTIVVFPFADLSDNSDGGNGFGFYRVFIGGTLMSSSVPGHVSGAPSDGKFRKTNGSRPSICCFHTGNSATIVVTDEFFNSKLGVGGAASDELFIQIQIPSGSNVPCAAVANGCANMDDGTHRAEITWTPAIPCNPPDCDDGNPCTDDTCNGGTGVCEHTNNLASCDDGLFCNGVDTCSGGTCTVHAGDPCAPAQLCCEGSDTCANECCDNAACDDGDPCNGDDICAAGVCTVDFTDCNGNQVDDICDPADCELDGDVDLADVACFQNCFGLTTAACLGAFDRALACNLIDLADYAVLNLQLTGPIGGTSQATSGGGGGGTSGLSAPVATAQGSGSLTGSPPVAGGPGGSWTVTQAALAFEVRPVGGTGAVTALAPNTTYELYYKADYKAVQGYTLLVSGTCAGATLADVQPATAGPWASTGRFVRLDLCRARAVSLFV